MKKLVRTSLLMLALSCTTYAGDMPYPAPTPAPVNIPTSTQGETPFPITSSEESTTGDAQGQSAPENILIDVLLALAANVLPLF